MGLIPWKHDGDHSAKRTLKASFDGRARSQERPWKEQKEGSGRVVEKNQWGLCPGGGDKHTAVPTLSGAHQQ